MRLTHHQGLPEHRANRTMGQFTSARTGGDEFGGERNRNFVDQSPPLDQRC